MSPSQGLFRWHQGHIYKVLWEKAGQKGTRETGGFNVGRDYAKSSRLVATHWRDPGQTALPLLQKKTTSYSYPQGILTSTHTQQAILLGSCRSWLRGVGPTQEICPTDMKEPHLSPEPQFNYHWRFFSLPCILLSMLVSFNGSSSCLQGLPLRRSEFPILGKKLWAS